MSNLQLTHEDFYFWLPVGLRVASTIKNEIEQCGETTVSANGYQNGHQHEDLRHFTSASPSIIYRLNAAA
jgi:hypothetical protein